MAKMGALQTFLQPIFGNQFLIGLLFSKVKCSQANLTASMSSDCVGPQCRCPFSTTGQRVLSDRASERAEAELFHPGERLRAKLHFKPSPPQNPLSLRCQMNRLKIDKIGE